MVKVINGRYTPQQTIGAGGMGEVHLALDRLTGEQVALKQINLPTHRLQFMSRPETSHETNLKLALAHEFQIMAGLRHPHILSVLDYGFNEVGNSFFTMPYLSGAQTFLEVGETLDNDGKLTLISQLLQALIYLHRRDVFHRDLKPNNILVTQDEAGDYLLKVLDFGLSTSAHIQNENNSSSGGTPHYLAPEIWLEQFSGGSADMFAVGVLAFQLFTAQPSDPQLSHPFTPLDGFFLDRVLEEEPNWGALTCDEGITQLLSQLLLKAPADRPTAQMAYQQVSQLLRQPAFETVEIRESYLQAAAFVGREKELTLLKEQLAQTKTGEGQAVLIGGESGVGKSRLLNEVRIHALVEGFIVLRGQAVEGGGLPFHLWRDIIRRLLLLVDVTDFQAGVLKTLIPNVDVLLNRPIPSVPNLTGQAYRERIIHTTIDLLRQVKQPLLLILEDLQRVTESLNLLKQILQVRDQLPRLMIVANYRHDETPVLPDMLASMTHLTLERLSEQAVSALSQAILGERGVNEELVHMLQRESEGNTFFIVEIMRALAEESGQLDHIGKTLPTNVLTGGMIQLTRRRLSKVPVRYQEVQTVAALIGRQIDMELLNHLYYSFQVEGWLTHAAEYDVVARQENRWQFAHDKLRETLIADIPDRQRASLHSVVAEAIETVYPDDSAYDEVLLHHWREAGNLDKELVYLDPIIYKMTEFYVAHHEKAQRLLDDALDRLPDDDPRRVPLLIRAAGLYLRLDKHAEAQEVATQCQQLALRLDDKKSLATSLNMLGIVAGQQHDFARANGFLEQAMALFREFGDLKGEAMAQGNSGIFCAVQGQLDEAIVLSQQSHNIFLRLEEPIFIARGCRNLGGMYKEKGAYERAKVFFQEGIAISKQIGDQSLIFHLLNDLGLLVEGEGKYEYAEELFEQGLDIARKIGDRRGIISSLNYLGLVAHSLGESGRALVLLQDGLNQAEQIDSANDRATLLSSIGWVKLEQGELTAVEFLTKGLRVAFASNMPSMLMLAYVVSFAGVLMQRGQLKRAGSLLGLVQNHPFTKADVQRRVDKLMLQLEAQLAPDEIVTVLEAGATLDLDEVVQELLSEL